MEEVMTLQYMDPDTVESLISTLQSEEGMARQNAREHLIAMGTAITPRMLPLLRHPVVHTRWEAAKVLAAVADPASTPDLVTALHDEGAGVRWLAAVGLAAIGRPAFVPLLNALIEDAEDPDLRHGVHHVLHDLRDPALRALVAPVWRSLNAGDPPAATCIAAQRVLDTLAREERASLR
jgi:HEAT repeat protein